MSAIEPSDHGAVELEARRYLTAPEKVRRWEECGRCCKVCGKPCMATGPFIVWDHRIPLALGGSNDLSNFEPNHAGQCAYVKTARDRKAIAKAKRLARDADPATRRQPYRKIRGRGFEGGDPLK